MAKLKTGKEDHGYISRIERGTQAPSIEYITELLDIYGKNEIQFISDVQLEYYTKRSPKK